MIQRPRGQERVGGPRRDPTRQARPRPYRHRCMQVGRVTRRPGVVDGVDLHRTTGAKLQALVIGAEDFQVEVDSTPNETASQPPAGPGGQPWLVEVVELEANWRPSCAYLRLGQDAEHPLR